MKSPPWRLKQHVSAKRSGWSQVCVVSQFTRPHPVRGLFVLAQFQPLVSQYCPISSDLIRLEISLSTELSREGSWHTSVTGLASDITDSVAGLRGAREYLDWMLIWGCVLFWPDVDERIILGWIFRKWEGVVGTGWNWLRIGTGGGHLWVRWGTFGFRKCGEFLD